MELVSTAVVGVRDGLRGYEMVNIVHPLHHSDPPCPTLSAICQSPLLGSNQH